jgi:hypothetical protein
MYVCFEYYMKIYIIHGFYEYVRISYNISYDIKYMITYHTFVMKVLILHLRFPIFKLLPLSSLKLYLLHFKNLF